MARESSFSSLLSTRTRDTFIVARVDPLCNFAFSFCLRLFFSFLSKSEPLDIEGEGDVFDCDDLNSAADVECIIPGTGLEDLRLAREIDVDREGLGDGTGERRKTSFNTL